MSANVNHIKNKAGRPKKDMPRNQLLAAWCTIVERKEIELKAGYLQKTISEFLRLRGLNTPIDIKEKALPKEVLQLTGTLHHLAASIHQLVYKNTLEDNFSAAEKAELKYLSNQVQELAKDIKSYLQ
jgi:hypothetical protein